MTSCQQVVSVDSKYNAFRTPQNPAHKTLYIHRRGQLLANSKRFEDNGKIGQKYLELRSMLLQQRYGASSDHHVTKSSHAPPRSSSRLTIDGDYSGNISSTHNTSLTPSKASFSSLIKAFQSKSPSSKGESSRHSLSGGSGTLKFEFSGMLHIFDQHKDMVSVVKFAHNDASLLGAASYDGSVSICRVTKEESCVLQTLQKHTAAVTAFDWSSSNELLVSAGMDGLICLWKVSDGSCLRSVRDQADSQILSCIFYPNNDNWIVAGNSVGYVQVLNISTGRYPQGGTSVVADGVTAVAFDHSGKILWAGNSKGTINSFTFDTAKGCLRKGKRVVVAAGASITCITYRNSVTRGSSEMSVLVNCACAQLFLFRVSGSAGGLELMRSFPVPHQWQPIQSTFSPIVSYGHRTCIVTGSEDCEVWILDPSRDLLSPVDKLQGHQSPVISVAFNYDESFLATSDATGLVIVWK